MSLVPLLFSDWWEDLERPHRLVDQNFGLGLHRDQLLDPDFLDRYIAPRVERRSRNPSMIYLRPWGELLRKGEGGSSTVKADKDQFQVSLDVQQCPPPAMKFLQVLQLPSPSGMSSEPAMVQGDDWRNPADHRLRFLSKILTMSLWPLLFSAWWAGLDQPHMLMDQNFGLDLSPEDLRPPTWPDKWAGPWPDLLERERSGTSIITANKHTFKVILDVQHFKPEEIKVKTVNRFVIIEAKHEEKKDKHGLISRQFVRKYFVPVQVDIDQLRSSISSDGVLTITAPVKKLPEKTGKLAISGSVEKPKETSTDKADELGKEKVINVEQTGKPANGERTENPKEASTDKTHNTEKEKVANAEKTGKPVISEIAKIPEESSIDKTDKTGKEKVANAEQTGKPVIPESTENPKETSIDNTDKTEKEEANKVQQNGKPAIQERAEKPKETSIDKNDKTEKENVNNVDQTGKPAIQENVEKPKETSIDKIDKTDEENVNDVHQTGKSAIQEKPKGTSINKIDKTEKENVNNVDQTGKPAIQEKPKGTSIDQTDKTEKENVNNADQTDKSAIQESAGKSKETSN
ncbi:heat shock protein 67B1-like [Belonocnema kinseyi]|uniref:heat shock protein 67B1-like n=1 Tax=Belonocnema kinseyi TaxID=2817044 RepID=UPI00143D325A|nr:heat shock protein 67B1-like [Belonocnema kinseyi]